LLGRQAPEVLKLLTEFVVMASPIFDMNILGFSAAFLHVPETDIAAHVSY
jgi:hypothetical protein